MLLLPLLAAASCLSTALAQLRRATICYGGTFHLPFEYTPPLFQGKLVFSPSSGQAEHVVIENKQVKDPRFNDGFPYLKMEGVTTRDNGIFRVENDDGTKNGVIRLVVKECGETVERAYMETFSRSPINFEYVEYGTMHDPGEMRLLWNRTDAQPGGGRAQVKGNIWEVRSLTHSDSGYYNFMKKDGTLRSRIKLEVSESTMIETVVENQELFISYPGRDLSKFFWTVTLVGDRVLMKDGKWLRDESLPEADFMSRVKTNHNSLVVNPVTVIYAGIYEFRDKEDNLILSVEVVVNEAHVPNYMYFIVIAVGVLLLIICCCCVKKCCCKKSASKRSAAAPQAAAAPATYYYDTTESSGPTYSAHSYSASPGAARRPNQPLNPVIRSGVAPSHEPPPTYNPELIHENPSQPSPAPQFTAPIPSFSIGSNCLSSDAEPRFELKGMNFLSAPPLGSDSTTTSDVYTSDKLNFL